jgi:hypothetical protein
MRDGELYVLDMWSESAADRLLSGRGTRYSVDRQVAAPGEFVVPVDSIALVEVTLRERVRPTGPTLLTVWGVISGITTGVCVADPKACFGSCPTFYPTDSSVTRPWAEGFSGSIARSLEATDVDALYHASGDAGVFEIEMRNEAFETHAVRSVRLIAVPRPAAGRVLVGADGRFHQTTRFIEPVSCRAAEGDCRDEVRLLDAVERRSWADSTDLAARETIDLIFPNATGPVGLVIGARHSLVSTYLFYQTMAYAGRSAGAWLAHLEREGVNAFPGGFRMMDLVGRIEIQVERDGTWSTVAEYAEQGPIATDLQVLPLSVTGDSLRLRLRLAQGSWRIDYLALAELGGATDATVLEPEALFGNGTAQDSVALERLKAPDGYLVTYSGDRYGLRFRLPQADTPYELFLESRGYYYEWMRSEWMAEENPVLLALVELDPAAALRVMAPGFKRREAAMEGQFWASRFGRGEP